MVQNKFVRREPEEYNWTDERFVPLKRKYLFIRQDNSKNPKKWGIINLVCAGISGFMYDFFIYDGKNSAELDDGIFDHLQKWTQVVAKLCEDFPGHKNYEVFFDSCFTKLDLLHHFSSTGIHAVGTIQFNCLRGCPLDANKKW